jgi:probable HAF family extracellular repeat protein
MNDLGDVAGSSFGRAVVWRHDGALILLPLLPAEASAGHYAINNLGETTGANAAPSGAQFPVLWRPGPDGYEVDALRGAGSRFAVNSNFGRCINDAGAVCGTSGGRPYVWAAWLLGGSSTLATLPGYNGNGTANGINYRGEMVGFNGLNDSDPATPPQRGVYWHDAASAPIDLGTLGGLGSFPRAINDLGDIVGQADTAQGVAHGFLISPD